MACGEACSPLVAAFNTTLERLRRGAVQPWPPWRTNPPARPSAALGWSGRTGAHGGAMGVRWGCDGGEMGVRWGCTRAKAHCDTKRGAGEWSCRDAVPRRQTTRTLQRTLHYAALLSYCKPQSKVTKLKEPLDLVGLAYFMESIKILRTTRMTSPLLTGNSQTQLRPATGLRGNQTHVKLWDSPFSTTSSILAVLIIRSGSSTESKQVKGICG